LTKDLTGTVTRIRPKVQKIDQIGDDPVARKDARIVEVEIKGEKWLRILVGEFTTENEAAKTRLDLLGLNKIGYARVVTIAAATR